MFGPRALIDLDAIAGNWHMFARRAAPGQAAGVVKADAYGLGADHVARALLKAGCKRLYVAWPREGVDLRKVIGPGVEIAVFHGPSAESLADFHSPQSRTRAELAGADRCLVPTPAPHRCTLIPE